MSEVRLPEGVVLALVQAALAMALAKTEAGRAAYDTELSKLPYELERAWRLPGPE